MKIFSFVVFFLLSANVFSQTSTIHLSFKDCSILTKFHPDSLYVETSRFYGNGDIQFYKDSIILTYNNEWECGKYQMIIDERIEWHEDSLQITAYSGTMTYYNINFSALLFRDVNGKILSFALDTEWIKADYIEFPSKRRVYYDLVNQNRQLLNTIGN